MLVEGKTSNFAAGKPALNTCRRACSFETCLICPWMSVVWRRIGEAVLPILFSAEEGLEEGAEQCSRLHSWGTSSATGLARIHKKDLVVKQYWAPAQTPNWSNFGTSPMSSENMQNRLHIKPWLPHAVVTATMRVVTSTRLSLRSLDLGLCWPV